MAIHERNEIDPQFTWDLSCMYESDEAFLAELNAAKAYPAKFADFKGRVSTDPAQLLAFLQLDDECDITLGKLANYANRKSDQDTRVSLYQDYSSQVDTLMVQIAESYSWFATEILAMAPEALEEFYAAEPDLQLYRRALNRILDRRPHTLSPAEEALLAAAGDMASQPENIFSLLNDADLTFPDAADSQGETHPVTHGSYIPLMTSADRALRKSAFQSLYGVYGQFRNTLAATLAAQTKQQKFFANARRYDNTLQAALSANEVPTSVYTNLISAVHDNMAPMHRYVSLRKRLLGVDELHFYDLYVPVIPDADMHFTYEEACQIMLQALAPLGDEYLEIVKMGLSQRWIDVYENPGKRSGAYSAGSYGTHPVILLNFQGTLDDVFTLVHEMGHSVHTYLSCQNQPSRYSDYVIFVAEVASTCNESLLMQWFLQNATDDKQRAYLLNHFLEQFRATLYRQTMFAEFELKANQLTEAGAGLTADALCDIYRQLNAEYFGPDMVIDDEIALEWARIPHFYYRYYVYQYATGFSAAIALSNRILTEGPSAVEDYLGFLKGGCSKPPIDLLRGAGVDMSSPEPVNSALALFDSLVTELSDLAEKL
ncbi:MAG: oligoendopeptidase F [Eggerthellales bacterium]|nr:oligoendopeptidase F [Eggerthellales bacterium]